MLTKAAFAILVSGLMFTPACEFNAVWIQRAVLCG